MRWLSLSLSLYLSFIFSLSSVFLSLLPPSLYVLFSSGVSFGRIESVVTRANVFSFSDAAQKRREALRTTFPRLWHWKLDRAEGTTSRDRAAGFLLDVRLNKCFDYSDTLSLDVYTLDVVRMQRAYAPHFHTQKQYTRIRACARAHTLIHSQYSHEQQGCLLFFRYNLERSSGG